MTKKILSVIIIIGAIILSFLGGKFYSESNYTKSKNNRCNTYISFAIGSLEELKSNDYEDILKVIICDIYAAKEYTTNNELESALYELWNALIFDGDNLEGREDELIEALKNYKENPTVIKNIALSMRTHS